MAIVPLVGEGHNCTKVHMQLGSCVPGSRARGFAAWLLRAVFWRSYLSCDLYHAPMWGVGVSL
jgi:hypothetical protein